MDAEQNGVVRHAVSPWQVVLHVRRMPKCSERQENLGLRKRLGGTSFEGRIVGCVPKVPQCPISVRNEKAYEYISMDNNPIDIKPFGGEAQKQKP